MANFASLIKDTPNITLFLVGFILVLSVLLHTMYSQKVVNQGPTLLTTIGIFSTFLGIALGLLNFNADDVQGSVPALLEGMKTAFFASVVGVGAALTIKFRSFILGVPHSRGPSGETGEATAEQLAALLKGIQQALVGNEDSSLITQMKLSRQDTNDRLDALKAAQNEALQKLSEMGSKALVEALRDVIKDFNARITEQFGENFRHLNEAVARLLVWQHQYKDYIDTASKRHDEVVTAMESASSHFSELVGAAGNFTRIADDLRASIGSADNQQKALVKILSDLSHLLNSASGRLPQIEEKIIGITQQLSKAMEENQRMLSASINETGAVLKTSVQSATQSLTSANQDFNKQMSELAQKTKEQIARLDTALSEELTKSLESLGRQLATLSERFVADYTPLTERLRRLLDVARATA